MLPTFVIGLREGLEAALIVGIVAAFLRQRGRLDALRWVWVGVAVAVVICIAVGVGLQIASANLPQKQQEGLETVVGVAAVLMVSYMAIWMRRHSRDLKGDLEGAADAALVQGSAWALVFMAFFAVLREGFETAVFLLAAFQESSNPTVAGSGALIGIVVAAGLGYGIYKGGVRINLSRFFYITGLVLVLVAAGLVMSAFHTAHEAGWINIGQERLFDLSWLVQPGTVLSSLLTGVLGIQPFPTVIEGLGWLLYFVPLTVYLAWPARKHPNPPGGRKVAPEQTPPVEGHTPAMGASHIRVWKGGAALGGIALLGLVLAGCSSNSNADSKTSTSGGNTQTIAVTLSNKGCTPEKTNLTAGPTKFQVKNDGGTKVSEVELVQGTKIIAEKENLASGFSGSFSLDLKPGDYDLYCPGADTERTAVKVTGSVADSGGSAAEQAALAKAVTDYKAYVQQQVAELVTNTKALAAAVDAGDIDKAKMLYPTARLNYERIEPVAESFGDLDPQIDGRAEDFATPDKFTGFHRIEQALWQDNTTTGMTPIAGKLVTDVESLQKLVATLDTTAPQIANGATELLNEVSNSKISGEEERYSHLDILDMAANIQGSQKAFELLKPALAMSNPTLATTVSARFDDMNKAMAPYETADGGYVLYNTLTDDQVRTLARTVGALAEPLSQVAGAVVGKS